MSLTDLAEDAFLTLLFQNVAWANVGNGGGLPASTAADSFYIALYTVNPTDSTTGTETTYGGYDREAVPRDATGSGWAVSETSPTQVANAAAVTFDVHTGGADQTVTGVAIMTALTGGDMIAWAALDNDLVVQPGTIPAFAAGDLVLTVD